MKNRTSDPSDLYEVKCLATDTGREARAYIWEHSAEAAKARIQTQMADAGINGITRMEADLPDQYIRSNCMSVPWQQICDYLKGDIDDKPEIETILPVLDWEEIDGNWYASVSGDTGVHRLEVILAEDGLWDAGYRPPGSQEAGSRIFVGAAENCEVAKVHCRRYVSRLESNGSL